MRSDRLGSHCVELFDAETTALPEYDVSGVLCNAFAPVLVAADVEDTSGLSKRAQHGVAREDRAEARGRLLGELDLDCDAAAVAVAGDEVWAVLRILEPAAILP